MKAAKISSPLAQPTQPKSNEHLTINIILILIQPTLSENLGSALLVGQQRMAFLKWMIQ